MRISSSQKRASCNWKALKAPELWQQEVEHEGGRAKRALPFWLWVPMLAWFCMVSYELCKFLGLGNLHSAKLAKSNQMGISIPTSHKQFAIRFRLRFTTMSSAIGQVATASLPSILENRYYPKIIHAPTHSTHPPTQPPTHIWHDHEPTHQIQNIEKSYRNLIKTDSLDAVVDMACKTHHSFK